MVHTVRSINYKKEVICDQKRFHEYKNLIANFKK